MAEGTNFANGDIRLQPGTSLVGWVPFTVPNGVRIATIRWTPPPASGPSDTVIAYFDAINNRDYAKAWDLGGKHMTSSYDRFVSGFATTSWAGVEILDVSGDIGTGVVTARLTTLETDGTSKTFQGEYTVRGGVIVDFNVHEV